MKQRISFLLLLFLVLPLTLFADFVQWRGVYDKAHQEAVTSKKVLLVLLVKKDSATARTLIKNVFMNQSYVANINEKTVPVIVTYEGSADYPVEMYYTTVFPALFFVESQKELLLKAPLYGDVISKEKVEKYMIELFN